MAMRIGGEIRHKYVSKRHWERLAKEIDVKAKVVTELLKEYSASIPDEAEALAEKFTRQYGGEGIVDQVVDVISKNSSAIRRHLS
jgi:hypothetical protein